MLLGRGLFRHRRCRPISSRKCCSVLCRSLVLIISILKQGAKGIEGDFHRPAPLPHMAPVCEEPIHSRTILSVQCLPRPNAPCITTPIHAIRTCRASSSPTNHYSAMPAVPYKDNPLLSCPCIACLCLPRLAALHFESHFPANPSLLCHACLNRVYPTLSMPAIQVSTESERRPSSKITCEHQSQSRHLRAA